MFYGMPIHIIRDVALTIRSFYKRITDFVRYRQATRDMNARYPDATPEEVAREDVCIICREEMRPWRQQNGPDHQQGNNTLADRSLPNSVDERLRPKKLPCGHILHFACLRSWLERQQNCPTCRRPVLVTATVTHAQEHGLANQHGRDRGQPNHPQAHVPLHGNPQQPIAAQNVFNLGPLRIAFGARHGIPGPPHQQNPPPPTPQGPVPTVGQIPHMTTAPESSRHLPGLPSRTIANFSPANVQLQLIQIEQQLLRDINALRVQQNQLHLVRALQGELARLRIAQANPEMLFGGPPQAIAQPRVSETMSQTVQVGQSFVSVPQQQILGHSHPGLPAGMTLPPGWTILPLQRLPDSAGANPAGRYGATARSAQMQTQGRNPTSGPTPRDANASPSTMNPNSESSFGLSGLAGHNFASKQPDYGASSSSTTQSYIAPSSLDEHVATDRPTEQDCGDESHASTGSTPNVFKWGSKSRSGELSQGELGDVGNSELETTPASGATIGDEGATLQTSTDTRQGKGKGRATTVEDSTEDID